MTISPHVGQGLDGTVARICQYITSPVPVVPITRIENFVFNTELLKHKEAVIVDYVEYGWDWYFPRTGTHFFGKNTGEFFPHFQGEEWKKFDDWVAGLDRVVYFKRELLKSDADIYPHVFPIDYPCWIAPIPPQTKEEFKSRPLSVFNFWGRSHEDRLVLHGNIWKAASEHGFSVCDNIYFLQQFLAEEQGKKWATFWMPHYSRIDIAQLLQISAISKISIAMPGAGLKTFRQSEVSVNSVMMMVDDDMEYAYDWVDGVNCIMCHEITPDRIMDALERTDLYDIYLRGLETADKYRIANYVRNYIEPTIQANL